MAEEDNLFGCAHWSFIFWVVPGAVMWWLTEDLYWLVFGVVLAIVLFIIAFFDKTPVGPRTVNERLRADFQARQQKAREANERRITQVEIEKKRWRREENRRYAKPFFPEFSAIKKPLGLAILSGGLWFIFLSQTMDTTVDVPGFPGKRVVNLELNSERQNYLILGGILLVSGIVLLNVPNKD